jgi:hypothetical protein
MSVAGYTYGNVRTFKTEDNIYLKINDIGSVIGGEATAKASVSGDRAGNVIERGFIYSNTITSPSVENSFNKQAITGGAGDFEVKLEGLAANSKYYVRAYARDTANKYYYSPVKEISTTGEVLIKISYRTSNGVVVGNEDIAAALGAVISAANLNVPAGYKLSGAFNYPVVGNDSFIVDVEPDVEVERAYAKGAGNKMFMPNDTMIRLDVVKMIYNLLGDGKTYDSARRFSDMPINDPEAVNAINFATSRGIISGYDDGTFGPYKGVTRAEMTVIINKALNLTPNNSVAVELTDISAHWGRTYITIAVQNGYIIGYEDKTFKPDRQVTRAEAVTMVANATKRSMEPLGTAQFTDVRPTDWFYRVIMNAAIPG